jgi:hypothetical protein
VNPPLLLLAPLEPCLSGNGLAMRVASFAEAASTAWDVTVAVVPVAGRLPFCPLPVAVPVVTVVSSDRQVVARRFAAMLADPVWRGLLTDSQPVPPPARAASAALAPDVLSASGAAPGTPVLAIRSYLAPLALAVAQHLASPWTALDLDDDDESLASAQGDDTTAAAYGRLVATFAPRFSGVSLARASCSSSPTSATGPTPTPPSNWWNGSSPPWRPGPTDLSGSCSSAPTTPRAPSVPWRHIGR